MVTAYLDFQETLNPGRKTRVWEVRNTVLLGRVAWWSHWRRYTFWPEKATILDAACLREVADFLEARMAERKP